jgi:two-component system, OmpR family, sensor histidine kinase TctE
VKLPGPPTLGRRLLRTVLLPLALTWVAGTIVSLSVAQYFAQRAFDRSLLDDAYLLAAHVHEVGARLQLDLTQDEVQRVLFDQAETLYFSVRGPDGELLAGEKDLRVPGSTASSTSASTGTCCAPSPCAATAPRASR